MKDYKGRDLPMISPIYKMDMYEQQKNKKNKIGI